MVHLAVDVFDFHRYLFQRLVGQPWCGLQVESAELCEEHAAEHESVLHAHECHFRLVEAYAHGQFVRPCCHSLVNHLQHVLVEVLEHVAVCGGNAELVAQCDDLPVGLVDVEDDVLFLGT